MWGRGGGDLRYFTSSSLFKFIASRFILARTVRAVSATAYSVILLHIKSLALPFSHSAIHLISQVRSGQNGRRPS